MLSRNKTIKRYHEMTGEPYSVCRARLKASGWSLTCIEWPSPERVNEIIKEISNGLANGLESFTEALTESANTFLELGEKLRENFNEGCKEGYLDCNDCEGYANPNFCTFCEKRQRQ